MSKELYTLARMLEAKDYKIEIPIIQRDYAQGRKDDRTDDVRRDFTLTLHKYLCDGKTHELDFVYGSSEPTLDGRKFIPLDGQQRLTTLFLLHWYLAQRCHGTDVSVQLSSIIRTGTGDKATSRFTYRTRQSASDFCNELVRLLDEPLDYTNLKQIEIVDADNKKCKEDSIESTIKNLSWYSPAWNLDPTVQSMLVMLDAIHKKFGSDDHEHMLKRLLDPETPAVAFTFMDLNDYNLTDDLYIKMNSRGKPLTPFENFKAKFEKYIGTVASDPIFTKKNREITEEHAQGKSAIRTLKQYFSFHIDTKWTNFFWAYCMDELSRVPKDKREKALEDQLDRKIANYIRVIFANAYAITKNSSLNKHILIDAHREFLSYAQYEQAQALSPYGVSLLVDSLDALCLYKALSKADKEKLAAEIKPFFDLNDVLQKTMGDSIANEEETDTIDKLGYVDRVQLHAFLLFIINFGLNDIASLRNWMRFTYNATHNPNREQLLVAKNLHATLIPITNLMGEMAQNGQPDVNAYLSTLKPSQNLGFESSIQREEIIKAHLRLKPSTDGIDWDATIAKYEDYGPESYFSGQVGFLFDMVPGIGNHLETNGKADWTDEQNKAWHDEIVKYGNLALEAFRGGYDNRELAKDALLERAMMTLHPEYIEEQNNMLTSVSNTYNLRRDISWKRRLHSNHHKRITESLKELFDEALQASGTTLRERLQGIIDNSLPAAEWIKRLVKSDKLFSYARYGFIECLYGQHILHAKKRNSYYDLETFTLDLYLRHIEEKESDFPGMVVEYLRADVSDMYPCIKADFLFQGLAYQLKLEHMPENNDFGHYFLSVFLPNSQPEANAILIAELDALGFEKLDAENNIYLLHMDGKDTEKQVLDKYKEIYGKINQNPVQEDENNEESM